MDTETINTNDFVASEKVESPAQEKKFTQNEIDKIIRDRLKREQENFKNKEDSILLEMDNLKTNLAGYESEFSKLIQPKIDAIPEEFKELIEKLPLLEKLAFVNKLENKKAEVSKLKLPKTPLGDSEKPVAKQASIGRFI